MSEQNSAAPTCPGCHFGCLLDAYQCARGKMFHERWMAGEEIPERRAPWKAQGAEGNGQGPGPRRGPGGSGGPGGPGGRRGAFAPEMRLMHMLNIIGIAMADHRETRPERNVIDGLARQSGCATERIVQDRSRLGEEDFALALAKLRDDGLVTDVDDEIAGPMLQISEAGEAQASAWREERELADKAFCDALSDEEKEELAGLLQKLLSSSAHEGKMR